MSLEIRTELIEFHFENSLMHSTRKSLRDQMNRLRQKLSKWEQNALPYQSNSSLPDEGIRWVSGGLGSEIHSILNNCELGTDSDMTLASFLIIKPKLISINEIDKKGLSLGGIYEDICKLTDTLIDELFNEPPPYSYLIRQYAQGKSVTLFAAVVFCGSVFLRNQYAFPVSSFQNQKDFDYDIRKISNSVTQKLLSYAILHKAK